MSLFRFSRLAVPLVASLSCVSLNAASRDPAVDGNWLQAHLKSSAPRLVWREGDEERIRRRIENDPVAKGFKDYLMRQADGIVELPALERKLEGRRLLQVSRSALKRATYLAFAWRVSGDRRYLESLEVLLKSVSGFNDWNPSHFLDVAEMSLAMAFALDWAGDSLSEEARVQAESALFEKGLQTGDATDMQHPFKSGNNWNQVCNAGIVAAALVLADEHPEMAVRAIDRMIENLPTVLKTYAPDGVYVEGAMYWGYGSEFNVVLFEILKTALGTDFGLADATGFKESADFVHLIKAPSGLYYDFYDSQLSSGFMGAQLWFAKETGQARYALESEIREMPRWTFPPESSTARLLPVEFLWYLQYEEGKSTPLPLNWVGHGENPIGVFRSAFDDPDALYLAFKGGKGTNGHGNLDAGSFILELDGVRWAIDLGNQRYHELEEYFKDAGGNLWSSDQDSSRWDLLTKNNFGHSTLSVDGQLHRVAGQADIVGFDAAERTATVDLSAALGDSVKRAERRFSVPDDRTVRILDQVELNEGASVLRWQLLTQADVRTTANGAVLEQSERKLYLKVLSPAGVPVTVQLLDPPPHPADKRMPGLKRLALVIPAALASEGEVEVLVELSSKP